MGKYPFLFLSLSLSIFYSKHSFAQGNFGGCLVNNKVYQTAGNSNSSIYDDSPSIPLSNNYCNWVANGATTPCTICVGGLNGGGNCPGNRQQLPGVSGLFTMVECPIDESYLTISFSPLICIVSVIKLNFKHKKTGLS